MKLFVPFRIRGLELRNRIVMPSAETGYATADGFVTDLLINAYARRAVGGAGLILIESALVDRVHKQFIHELRASGDEYIPGLTRLADAVHAAGARIGLQLRHVGRAGNPALTGVQPIAPSPIPISPHRPVPHELTVDEIDALVEEFAEGAWRAREAGFDLVEFHGAHGYLICSFFSPATNQRTDRYGGDIARRAQFGVDLLRRTRAKVGDDFVLSFRISGAEYIPGGLTLEETTVIASLLEQAGADIMSVSAGSLMTPEWSIPPMMMPEACDAPLSRAIKTVVRVPVITAGRIHTAELAERVLQDGTADLVGICRALIADPDLPRKAEAGRFADIRPCVSCNTCTWQLLLEKPVVCLVNPEAGREGQLDLRPAARRQRVLVAGGGPAGLEAARIARRRGHEVILCEREGQLGGKLDVVARAPSKRVVFKRLLDHLVGQVEAAGVEVRLGTPVTPALVESLHPDAVVVATGSTPIVPPIPGVDLPHVALAEAVLRDQVSLGKRVVVIGGGATAIDVAEYLLEAGHQITVLEMLEKIGKDIEPISRNLIFRMLRKHGVELLTRSKVMRIEPDRVCFLAEGGVEDERPADSVVVAVGLRPNNPLAGFQANGTRILPIGDSGRIGTILEALTEAALTAAGV